MYNIGPPAGGRRAGARARLARCAGDAHGLGAGVQGEDNDMLCCVR